jgi:TolB protein
VGAVRSGIVLALATLPMSGAVQATPTTLPAVNGRIAFFSGAGIALINAGGDGTRYVPGTAAGTENPVWSPDGTLLLAEIPGTGRDDRDVVRFSGTGQGRLRLTFSPAFDGDPAWAAGGSRIVFESTRSGDPELWTMLADSRRQEQLTSSPGFDGDPAVSPDGSQLAFTSARAGNRELYTMRLDGSELRRLTFTGGAVSNPDVEGVDENPSWSPDGRSIVFDSSRDGDFEIYVMRADGSGERRLTDHPALDARSVWSPDGKVIVFESDRAEKSRPCSDGGTGRDGARADGVDRLRRVEERL